ncbi:SMI1/KNR4 family protein [Nocardiopsis ganjiahuensis]|uniref:SMI1/KNR4 family protein n=1 Tax=Nocardiopsis ganjiahuensis TaxID=239984 RepID=UPI001EF9FBA1|nr:SMI1/KNR4 family protein [Nocardiopsis ganjiahuensis]
MPGARDQYGANGRSLPLAVPLSEAEVAEAEMQWGVSLPDDYRGFLLEVGAGGAGPGYGLSTLRRTATGWAWIGEGPSTRHATLSVPFPTAQERERLLAEHEDREPDRAGFATQEAFDAAYREWRGADDDLFNRLAEGAVCLSHEGCDHFHWLVMTGAERGNMWVDGFPAEGGFRPLGTPQTRISFTDWYLGWVATSEVLPRQRFQRKK